MKFLKRLPLCLMLALVLTTSVFAAEVPDDLVVENLNGQQRLVKTYTLSPDIDPDTLQEPSFDYDGFTYTWAYTTKEDHSYLDTKDVTKTVTVETSKNDLTQILAEMSPTLSYDDGQYTGELALDHTTLSTEAAGYTTKSNKVTETKVIGNLDRNDMSYVPATTTKDGRTLSLANVEWQVTGTALVGESLVPSQYQAVATYSASSSYQVATGYVTTAEYRGEVSSSGIDSVTYTVVYTGVAITPEVTAPAGLSAVFGGHGLAVLAGVVLLLLLIGLCVLLLMRRKNVYVYVPGEQPRDYQLVAKFRVTPEKAEIDISDLDIHSQQTVAIELKPSLAKELLGQSFTVQHEYGTHRYLVLSNHHGDWHEFDLKEEPICDSNDSAE
jgi:hypothetical protein